MPMLSNPVYVATVLLLLVLFAEWLGQRKYFHYLGASLIVILSAAILANAGLLASSQAPSPLYDGIFSYAAPLAIFFLLLDVRLKDLSVAGLPMLLLFLAGSATTCLGAIAGFYLLQPQHHGVVQAYAVAGMYTGTYTGGSANLNAVGLQYGVNKNGTLFAAINAVDNILGTIWIMLTILLPPLLQRWLPRKKRTPPANQEKQQAATDTIRETITVTDVSWLLVLGFATLLVSNFISTWVPQIPSILTLTTIALLLAQTRFVARLRGGKVFGYFLVLLFLAVIGAYCDVQALLQSGGVAVELLLWVAVILMVHGLLLFVIGGLFKQDWDMVSIASNANVGGTATAAVLATALGRPDLRLPGLLVGSVGNAIGTYLGILIAEMLK
jgi:uncharacterized membrane protein